MANNPCPDGNDDAAVELLREYIRIPSVTGCTDYADCVKFLECQASKIGIECKVLCLMPGRPVVMMKWEGTARCLPSIVLLSHMDVVPADICHWTHPPFEGIVDEEGKIFGRGAQTMKMTAVQYLEAIKRLKAQNIQLARTIILLFTPEEENDGLEGMKLFVESQEFKCLNIGLCFYKSIPSQCNRGFIMLYGEKHKCTLRFHLKGDGGCGCRSIPNTAAEKLSKLLTLVYEMRCKEFQSANEDPECPHNISLNATVFNGGDRENRIPTEITVTIDVRLPPNVDLERWKRTIDEWKCKIGGDVCVEEVVCDVLDKPTPLDCDSNPFYKPMVCAIEELGFDLRVKIFPGSTDARFLRHLGIPVFGLSTLNGVCAHPDGHDEAIEKEKFLNGINVYCKILETVGNIITK